MKALVVGRPADLAPAGYNAFIQRTQSLIEGLPTGWDLDILLLRRPSDRSRPRARAAEAVSTEIALPEAPGSRGARILDQLGRRLRLRPWERQLDSAVRACRPDVALALGPWLAYEYRSLFAAVPTVLFADEDVQTMVDVAPQSGAAQLLRRVERRAERLNRGQPSAVILVSDTETADFARRFPRARLVTLPYVLDPAVWEPAEGTSEGDAVIVVGNLTEARHTDELVPLLHLLHERTAGALPVDLVSGAGLSTGLRDAVAKGLARHVGSTDDLPQRYRHARLALVPASRATGIKTTILQGWVTGCPVVAHEASAATVGPARRDAVVSAATTDGLVEAVVDLWNDGPTRDLLAARGLTYAPQHLDAAGEHRRFADLLAATAATAES